ncbi:MAG: type IV secretory system conjugative DNA transfer family protein [Microbacteriaceae bacterium]|nr:type IV secretory system conjugative DNA transfer family protein [Microbacteriaceae bacterium]
MSVPGSAGSKDQLTNLALLALAGGVVLIAALRAAGSISAWLSGQPEPTGGIGAGLKVFSTPLDPGAALGAPGLNAILYWLIAGIITVGPIILIVWVWVRLKARKKQPVDLHTIEGVATPREVAKIASRKRLIQRAGVLRPSLQGEKSEPEAVGFLLGRSTGQEVWATVEDSMLLVGPPRSGKGLNIMVNAILDAPGAVVATSTRPDSLAVTMKRRAEIGPVAVFDPQHLAPGLAAGLRWSPVRGCERPLTAMIRARGFAQATGFGDVESGGFWEGKTRSVIATLLHAAAIDKRDALTLFEWTLSPTAAEEAQLILENHPKAARGWSWILQSTLKQDAKTRDSIWAGVSLAFDSLADPKVLDAVTPGPNERFSPREFLRDKGTLYLLATAEGASASGPLVAALIEDIVGVARQMAFRSTRARLDPPLLLALDEIGNLAPLPTLPQLMSDGGGTGITVLPVVQSIAQMKQNWSEAQADTMWGSAIAKIVLGGLSDAKVLSDLKTLFGERDEVTESTTTDHFGNVAVQRSVRRMPVLTEDQIRTLPEGMGIIMLRSARPIITDLRPWPTRSEAQQLIVEQTEVEELIRAAHAAEDDAADEPWD